MKSASILLRDELLSVLKEEVGNKFKRIVPEEEVIIGNSRFQFDLYLEKQQRVVIIEIEAHRSTPLHNVAKVLYWISMSFKKKEVLLIQIFEKSYYCDKKKTEMDLAVFLGSRGKQIGREKRFKYYKYEYDLPKSLFKSPSKHIQELNNLAQDIFRKISCHF